MLCRTCQHGIPSEGAFGAYYCLKRGGILRSTDKCIYYVGIGFPVEIAIITSTLVESKAVKEWLLPNDFEWSRFPQSGDISWCKAEYKPFGSDQDTTIRIVTAQSRRQGLPAAAIQASRACQLFQPNLLVMLGITAGDKKETNLGDIVIPSVVLDYGAGKWKNDAFHPGPHQLDMDELVERRCEVLRDLRAELDVIANEWPGKIPGNTRLEVRLGHTASGAAVIDSKPIWKRIKGIDREVTAIDMEAYSVAFAAREAREPSPKVLIAKAVCDFGIGKTGDAQEYAAYTSARFFRLYLNRFFNTISLQYGRNQRVADQLST